MKGVHAVVRLGVHRLWAAGSHQSKRYSNCPGINILFWWALCNANPKCTVVLCVLMCGTYLVLKVLCVFEEPQTLGLRGRQSAGGENDISVPDSLSVCLL